MDRHTAQQILAQVREKQGNDPLTVLQDAATTGLKQEALRDAGRVAMFSLGLGAGARGAVGLYNVLKRNTAPPPKTRGRVAVLPLPVKSESLKTAGWLSDFFSGSRAVTKEGIPWRAPAMLLGGLAAGYGGWKGVDALLDRAHRENTDEDVERARQEFNQALLGEYTKPVKFKTASDTQQLSPKLDALFDSFEKVAGIFDSMLPSADTMGNIAGHYGLYAVPAALIAGYASYSAGKKRQRAKVLADALKARAMRRQQQQPAELFAMPVPVEFEPAQKTK